MRPPEFTGGNRHVQRAADDPRLASMRPPEFTGGNQDDGMWVPEAGTSASMRPPEFTGGNSLSRLPSPKLYALQ